MKIDTLLPGNKALHDRNLEAGSGLNKKEAATATKNQDSVKKAVAPELGSIQEAEMLGENLAERVGQAGAGALGAIGQLDEERLESLLLDED